MDTLRPVHFGVIIQRPYKLEIKFYFHGPIETHGTCRSQRLINVYPGLGLHFLECPLTASGSTAHVQQGQYLATYSCIYDYLPMKISLPAEGYIFVVQSSYSLLHGFISSDIVSCCIPVLGLSLIHQSYNYGENNYELQDLHQHNY